MSDIRISAEQWNSVSPEARDKIIAIYRNVGILGHNEQVVPDPNIEPTTISPTFFPTLCELACDTAATAVAAACAVLAPEFIPACLAGAEIARRACRDEC